MRTPFRATLGIDEALGGVYENAALGDEGTFFVVDFSIATVRLGGHLLEEASAAECRLQSVPSGLADHKWNPGVGMGTLSHLSGVLVEKKVMLDENQRMVSLFQYGHELEDGKSPADFQCLKPAVQP
jgi:hypothetical protein